MSVSWNFSREYISSVSRGAGAQTLQIVSSILIRGNAIFNILSLVKRNVEFSMLQEFDGKLGLEVS